jgi:anti-sigma B factor antagonist
LKLSLETRVTGDFTVIFCTGRIVYGIEAAALSEAIAELLPQTRQLVVDLSGVEMVDAAGLGELVSAAVMAQTSDCSIKLAAPSDFVRQLLDLTNLTSVFEVYPTLNAATLAFRGRAA